MTKTGWGVLSIFLAVFTCLLLQAEEQLRTLTGSCSITATSNGTEADLRLERSGCEGNGNCSSTQAQEPLSAFSGFALADLQREGAHMDARIRAEAGTITCSGTVHGGRMSGDFTFVPAPAFVDRMLHLGFRDLEAEKLQAYTLFDIGTAWVRSLQTAGVSDLHSGNLIGLRIFHVDADY